MKALKCLVNRLVADQRGAVLAIVAAALVGLLGFTALVTDIGLLAYNRQKLINIMDATALSGAQELPNQAMAVDRAYDYAEMNGFDLSRLSCIVSNDKKTLTASGNKDVGMAFAKIFGIFTRNVSATATAQMEAITSYTGVAPLSVSDENLNWGVTRTLKYDNPELGPGNFGVLALGEDRGASVVKDHIINGFPGKVQIGVEYGVDTEPGSMTGPVAQAIKARIEGCTHNCTFTSHKHDCSRVLIIPVYDSNNIPQGRDRVTIVGFAAFFIDNYHQGQKTVTGKFIKKIVQGDSDADKTNFGLVNVRLIK